MFKIDEFSMLVRVSPRMLRHWEKCGLLYPAEIDRDTGYRWYSAAQIPLLNIVVLRELEFSLDEIEEILPRFGDAISLAATLRIGGPYDGHSQVMSRLAACIEENDYQIAGVVRGAAIRTGADQNNPQNYLTELQIPVRRK